MFQRLWSGNIKENMIILWQSSSHSWVVVLLLKCQFWQKFFQYKTTVPSDFPWITILSLQCKGFNPKQVIKNKSCFATACIFYFPKQHIFRKVLLLVCLLFMFTTERLTENLRIGQTSIVAAQMFLFFRVLLLRISPQHLTSLWPIMVTELVRNK